MTSLPYIAAAFVVGMLVSTQPALNAILARAIASPYAATSISILVAFVCSLVVLALTGRGELSAQTLGSVPLWVFLAGVVGMLFVGGGIVIAPVIGALAFFICVVAGQLVGAALADHFGAFGLVERALTPQRGLGIVMVVAGAWIVSRG